MITLILQYGLVYAGLMIFCLSLIAMRGPRIMLHSYPPAIQEVVPPKTAQEKRDTLRFGWPFFALFVLYPLGVTLYTFWHKPLNFVDAFLLCWGITFLFNVFDLLVLDWIMFCTVTPRFVVLPGTEGHPGYKDYWFHFKGFLKGTVITLVAALAIAGIAMLLLRYFTL